MMSYEQYHCVWLIGYFLWITITERAEFLLNYVFKNMLGSSKNSLTQALQFWVKSYVDPPETAVWLATEIFWLHQLKLYQRDLWSLK